MKCEAVAQGLSNSFTAWPAMLSASFPASGFDVTLNGMPNFNVTLRLFHFDLGHSSMVVPTTVSN